jgi:thiamine-phosphate pyrophosphorylase
LRLPNRRPLLYLISNRRAFARNSESAGSGDWSSQLSAIRAAAQAGCQLIQIREKDLTPRELCELTRAAIAAARPHGARVLVNDRRDVALASGADGVHLRANSMPVGSIRAALKNVRNFLIGVSTHSLEEAKSAETGGADFIVSGPVYRPSSKQIVEEPLGLDRFAEVCQKVSIPVLALGGIDLSNFREPLRRGAAGVAAIGMFSDLDKIDERVRQLLIED